MFSSVERPIWPGSNLNKEQRYTQGNRCNLISCEEVLVQLQAFDTSIANTVTTQRMERLSWNLEWKYHVQWNSLWVQRDISGKFSFISFTRNLFKCVVLLSGLAIRTGVWWKKWRLVDPKLKTSFYNDYSRHANVKCDQGIVFLFSAALVLNYGLSYSLDRELRQLNSFVRDCFF